jgi:GntR family transcriptional regulator
MTVGVAMMIQINYKSGKPVYLQVVDQIKAAVASGALKPDEPLPTIRPLAEELRLNRNTIAKAYAELENQGVIETLPGRGCFVKSNASPLKKDIRLKLLSQEVDAVIVQAHHLQVPAEEFLDLVRDRLKELEKKRRAAMNTTGRNA